MAGFKKVNNSKQEYPSQNIPSNFTVSIQNDEQKEHVLKKCYDKFLEFPLEHQQKIIQSIQPQPQAAVKEKDQILEIINFLIEKDKTIQQSTARQRMNLIANKPKYEIIMRVFEAKFAQMQKSKEEMIKFCMRKAFKFVYDKIVSEKKQKLNKKEQKQLKNEYFGITNESEYALPFRDDSAEKTMNDDFLKKTFALNNFINDYKLFLENYDEILEKDNQKKIAILVDQILETEDTNFEQGILKIKRIPWSREILEQTKQLAQFLLQKYGTINESLTSSKPSNQNNSQLKDAHNNIQSEGIFNDQSLNFQNSQANNSNSNSFNTNTFTKQKQPYVSYEEFKKLILSFSKNPYFKELVMNLLKDFNKNDQSNLESTNFQDFQHNSQTYSCEKNDSVNSANLNINQKHQNVQLASELNQNLPHEQSIIVKENQLMQSPERSGINNEKNLNTKTLQRKSSLEKSNSMCVKEELNDSTKIHSFREKTPELSSFKAFKSTSQFNISPIGNIGSMSQSANLSQKNFNQSQNQQIGMFGEQIPNSIAANPFNQVNLQGLIGQQEQIQQQNLQSQNIYINPYQRPNNNILPPVNITSLPIESNNQNFNQNLYLGMNEMAQQMNLNNADNTFYQQPFTQANQSYVEQQDSFKSIFLSLLLYFDQNQQNQQQQQQQNQINFMNQDLLNFQNLLTPPISAQDYSLQDLAQQTKQYLQAGHTQLLTPQSLIPNNEFYGERNLSLIQNQTLKQQKQQNSYQNSGFSNNVFSNLVNEVSLDIPKQNLVQDQNLLKRMNPNSQFYYPVSESQKMFDFLLFQISQIYKNSQRTFKLIKFRQSIKAKKFQIKEYKRKTNNE